VKIGLSGSMPYVLSALDVGSEIIFQIDSVIMEKIRFGNRVISLMINFIIKKFFRKWNL